MKGSGFCEELDNILYPLWAADNVDVQKSGELVPWNGNSTSSYKASPFWKYHNTETEGFSCRNTTKRIKITDYPYSRKEMTSVQTTLKLVPSDWYPEDSTQCSIELLRVCASLKSPTPQFGGAMRMLCKNNEYPGKQSVFMCPLIDLKSDNLSCIYNLHYFALYCIRA